jgi:hypothetical protein
MTIAMTGETVDLERIAYHETGHVAGWRQFERSIFLERGQVLIAAYGYGRTNLNGGAAIWGLAPLPPVDHGSGVAVMAGRAAEAIRYPGLPRAELVQLSEGDELEARRFIRILYGSDLSDDGIAARVEAWEAEASQMLRGVWAGVNALAETLLARVETASGDEVELTGAEALHVMDTAL